MYIVGLDIDIHCRREEPVGIADNDFVRAGMPRLHPYRGDIAADGDTRRIVPQVQSMSAGVEKFRMVVGVRREGLLAALVAVGTDMMA